MNVASTPTATTLFEAYSTPVYRYLLRMVGHPAAADELTQDTFVRIIRALPSYEARGHDRAWVFGIARNVLRNHHRTSARKSAPSHLSEDPQAETGPAEDRIAIADALAQLPDVDREVFVLREVGGLSYAEIAPLTELSIAAVRNRIFRARTALRELLRPVTVPEPSQSAERIGS